MDGVVRAPLRAGDGAPDLQGLAPVPRGSVRPEDARVHERLRLGREGGPTARSLWFELRRRRRPVVAARAAEVGEMKRGMIYLQSHSVHSHCCFAHPHTRIGQAAPTQHACSHVLLKLPIRHPLVQATLAV